MRRLRKSPVVSDSGTAPLCFKSYDVYTLEAFASMNNPAGTEVAGRGYREVVSVSPPATLRLYCESQYDFNQMMMQLSVALLPEPLTAHAAIAMYVRWSGLLNVGTNRLLM